MATKLYSLCVYIRYILQCTDMYAIGPQILSCCSLLCTNCFADCCYNRPDYQHSFKFNWRAKQALSGGGGGGGGGWMENFVLLRMPVCDIYVCAVCS